MNVFPTLKNSVLAAILENKETVDSYKNATNKKLLPVP